MPYTDQFSKKYHRLASTASNRKPAKIQHDNESNPPIFFSKYQNEAEFNNLDDSVVNAQTLEHLQPHWPQQPLQPLWPHQPLQPYFIKELPEPDGWIIPDTKMTNTGPFL